MSMVFFIDESGHDRRESPYEVVGGIAIPQSQLWPFVCSIRTTISQHFGPTELLPASEIKSKSLLKNKRLADAFGEEIPVDQRRVWVQELFQLHHTGKPLRRYHLDAYAQSCRFFCRDILNLCQTHSTRVLAAIIDPAAPRTIENGLRADYAGLFYKLYEYSSPDPDRRSMIIHDERDDSECRKLAQQLYVYYVNEGKEVAQRVVPEPMFVKSHLTLGVLVADIVAYILSWGFRHAQVLTERRRPQLAEFAQLIREVNHIPEEMPENLDQYGILYIRDLADLQQWSNKNNG